MAWEAIGSGVLATALAWLQVFAWAALGSVLVAREPEPRIALPVAILAGITFTGFAHALFAWAGWAHAFAWAGSSRQGSVACHLRHRPCSLYETSHPGANPAPRPTPRGRLTFQKV